MSKALDPKDTCVLVTGGAGFIGSHTVVQLLEGGYQVVVVDDLSNSSAVAVDRVKTIVGDEAAKNLTFYEANVLDRDAMNKIFDTHQIDRVIHFAGFKAVGESVSKPVEYYHNNIENTLVLIDVMRNHGCKSIIFSSSSTVYGDPDNPPVTEEDPKKPATNPYGWTKWMIEQILMDVHTADPEWDVVLLRYFNPIGAHPSGLIGEDPKGIPNNLVPYVAQVAVGKLEAVQVFGNDYPTPDGTGVRDYIHVVDLAVGHIAAIKFVFSLSSCLHRCILFHCFPTSVFTCACLLLQKTRREGMLHIQLGCGPRIQRARDDPRHGEGGRAPHPIQDHAAPPRRRRRAHVRPQQGAPRARLEGHARHRRHVRRHLALADHEPPRLSRRRAFFFQVILTLCGQSSSLLFRSFSSPLFLSALLLFIWLRKTHELQDLFFLFESSFFRSKTCE